jgi:hypothetical protein
MLFRIFLAAALVFALMLAIKDGRVLRDAGLKASCKNVAVPAGEQGFWAACKKGKLDGRPDLSRQGCKAVTIRGKVEWWRCDAALGSSQGS